MFSRKPQTSILIVNDDELMLDTAKDWLLTDKTRQWKIYGVKSDQELETVLSARKVEVAIVDKNLEAGLLGEETGFNRNGFEVARMLKARGIRVGITSAYVRPRDQDLAAEMGIMIFDILEMSRRGEQVWPKLANEILEQEIVKTQVERLK